MRNNGNGCEVQIAAVGPDSHQLMCAFIVCLKLSSKRDLKFFGLDQPPQEKLQDIQCEMLAGLRRAFALNLTDLVVKFQTVKV